MDYYIIRERGGYEIYPEIYETERRNNAFIVSQGGKGRMNMADE